MCLAPILVKNPYYHLGDKGINFLHNTHNAYIEVPCGKCKQCIAMRQYFMLQRVQMESLRSDLFFVTLTYDNKHLPYINIGEYNLPYADINHVQNLFKRLRVNTNINYRYMFVTEYGTIKHRPHLHGIIAIPKNKYDNVNLLYHPYEITLYENVKKYWSENIGTRKNPIYEPLFTHVTKRGRTNFELHSIKPVQNHDNDVSYYITKYITKYDSYITKLINKIRYDRNLSTEETKELIQKIKPRLLISKSFGDYRDPQIKSYIDSCIQKNSEIPSFYDINTGKQMLLSPYYRKLLPVSYRFNQFYNLRNDEILDSFIHDDDSTDYDNYVKYLTNIRKNSVEKLQKDLENKYK